MKLFLNLSCAIVCAVLMSVVQQAYGWWAWGLASIACGYVVVAQWYVGRYYE